MAEMELGEVQLRFAELVWQHAPLPSGQLVGLCQEALHWKKPTTYTVLRKLCEKGLFANVDGMVTPLISREEFYAARSSRFVADSFSGSLPAFVAAFLSHKSLSPSEAEEIRQMIDGYQKESER